MNKRHLKVSAIKNGQISLYCYSNKIINGPKICFQSPVLSQKHARNMCHTVHQYLTKFHFNSTFDPKEISNIAMPIMTSQVLKTVNYTKTGANHIFLSSKEIN